MASLIGIVGGDPGARSRFLESAFGTPGPPGERTTVVHRENGSIAWRARPSVPFAAETAEGGPLVLLAGDFGGKPAMEGVLERIRRSDREKRWQWLTALDGYHFICVKGRSDETLLAADLLGLFPLYYYSTPRFLVFGTSASFIRRFPEFSPTLDAQGLAGLLLFSFIPAGPTLWKGVRRLTPGRYLRWSPGEGAREEKGDWITPSERHFNRSFDDNLELVDSVLTRAFKRGAARTGPVQTLLSGGLDSRLLAGYLHEAHGSGVTALTQGDPEDFESECARRVSRSLGWKHEQVPADESTFLQDILQKIETEGLLHGLSTPFFSQLADPLAKNGPYFYTGLHGDSSIGWATVGRMMKFRPALSPESALAYVNRYGFDIPTILKLVRPEVLGRSVEELTDALRQVYESAPGHPFQRAWVYDLVASDRFQVGFIPAALAGGAWPVLPFLDRELLESVSGMPYETLAGRRLQKTIVCRRFPVLARLPLDRNSYDTAPVYGLRLLMSEKNIRLSSRLRLLGDTLSAKALVPLRKARRRLGGRDPRFYHRTFDLNRPGWVALRALAEKNRKKASTVFDPEKLDQVLPGPERVISLSDGILNSHRLKSLLGFLVWSGSNL